MFARKILVVTATLMLIAGLANADVKLIQKQHTDGFTIMGQTQPATSQTTVMWVGKDRMRTDTGDASIIVRMDQKKIYMVKHQEKTFSIINLPVDVKSLLPEGVFEQMMEMVQLEAEVTATGETSKIGDWSASKYHVQIMSSMMQTRQEVWATTDVKLDFESFLAMTEETLKMQPGSAGIIEELRKVKGLQIKQRGVMKMMGTEVVNTSEIISAEELDAPAATYDSPQGYSETPFDLMKELEDARK